MRPHHPLSSAPGRRRLLAAVVAIGACLAAVGATAPAEAKAPARLDGGQFHGVNWADPRDNYVDGRVVPTGLSIGDSPSAVRRKASQVLTEFRRDLGVNTIRLPVNPYSVGTAWWKSYRVAIDTALHQRYNIVLSYWEGTAAKDGKIDDPAAWTRMWDTLARTYRGDKRVFLEPMNEPFGYSQTEWISTATQFVQRYTERGIPRNRIFVSGIGYNDHVDAVCAAPALHGTYVSQHFYGFWGNHDYAGWVTDLNDRLGDSACDSRTVLDEFGSPMTTGIDYRAPATAAASSDDANFAAYLQATADVIRSRHLGAIYWPGLRADDTYSLETLRGSGRDIRLTVNSSSGRALLRWAWGYGATAPHPAS